MHRETLSARMRQVGAALVAACAVCHARDFKVAPGGSIHAAVEEARRTAGAPHRIVLSQGRYFMPGPIVLDARDRGLSICGAGTNTVVFGGMPVTGWTQESGTPFWSADVPGSREGTRDFRVLLVDGEAMPRAKIPGGTNRFELAAGWDMSPGSGVMGVWAREPTFADYVTLRCRKEDLPPSLDIANAEVMHYHIWRDSYARVASNDAERAILWMAHPGSMPIGAAKYRKYEIYNVREGMKEPGQWYLDRTRGRVVYWPRPGEDMAKVEVVAPTCETAISVSGADGRGMVEDVSLCDFTLACVSAAPENAVTCGDAGGNATPAILFRRATRCVCRGLDISRIGGVAVCFNRGVGNRLVQCRIHDVGACGVYLHDEKGSVAISNEICRTGRLYASSAGMRIFGSDIEVRSNHVDETPYCGISASGTCLMIENNEISRSMMGLEDGGGIFGNMRDSLVIRNTVHDIFAKKRGARGIYLDECSDSVVVAGNVLWNVPEAIQCHLARDIFMNRNVVMDPGDVSLVFANAACCTFTENVVWAGRSLDVVFPEAVTNWTGNRVYRPAGQARGVQFHGNDRPVVGRQPKRPPVFAFMHEGDVAVDGLLSPGEWADRRAVFNYDAGGRRLGGAATSLRASWNPRGINFVVNANIPGGGVCTTGTVWGVDDAFEFDFDGGRWIRLFACGRATASHKELLEGARWFCGMDPRAGRSGGRYPLVAELSVPCAALGVSPSAGTQIGFNLKAYLAPIGQMRHWEAPAPFADGTAPADPPGCLLFKEAGN